MIDSLLICIDTSNGKDKEVLVVGRKRKNQTLEIVNAFQGEEAVEMYKKLTTKPDKKGEKND